jgi:hypothetical protein
MLLGHSTFFSDIGKQQHICIGHEACGHLLLTSQFNTFPAYTGLIPLPEEVESACALGAWIALKSLCRSQRNSTPDWRFIDFKVRVIYQLAAC